MEHIVKDEGDYYSKTKLMNWRKVSDSQGTQVIMVEIVLNGQFETFVPSVVH